MKVNLPCQPGCTCRKHKPKVFTAEARKKMSEAKTGTGQGFYMQRGYKYLTRQHGHPLASPSGALAEHRKVLYEKLGPGNHQCYWCGKLLSWGGRSGINADHLDDDITNNHPSNLEPACCGCNRVGTRRRSRRTSCQVN